MSPVVPQASRTDSPAATTPLLTSPPLQKAIQFVVIWLAAEVIIGGLGPLLFSMLEIGVIGMPGKFTLISVSTATDLMVVSIALAVSRVPELIEEPHLHSYRVTILTFLLVLVTMVALTASTSIQFIDPKHMNHSEIRRIYITAAIILLTTLALGIWAQVERAIEAAEDKEPKHAHWMLLPPKEIDQIPPRDSTQETRPTVWASVVLGAMLGYLLSRRSRN